MSRKVLAMFVVALRDFTRNNCPYVAAGIAYWTLFSIFPLVLAGIAILGFLYVSPEEQSEVVEGVLGLVPVSADYLTSLIEEVSRARGTLGVLAVVGLLWGGTAVFSAVRKGINHSWHIGQPHNFVLERAIDSIMLLGVTLLAFILAVFTTNVIGFSTFAATPEWLGGNVIGKVLLEIVALVTTCGVLAALYRYVPNTRVEWEMYGLVRSWEGLCFMESGSASHGSCPTLAISTCYMVPWVRSWRCWSGPTSPHWP